MRSVIVAGVLVVTGAAWGQCELDKVFADDGEPFEQFGDALAIEGDTIVAGSDFNGASNEGAAYVYERVGAEWVQTQKLIGSDTIANDHFGNAVAMDGGTLMVGAYLADGPPFDQGAVYVFENVGGAWVEQQKLMPPEPDFQGQFGYAIDIDDDRALISEIWSTENGQLAAGAVHVFDRVGGEWTLVDTIVSPAPATFDQLGIDVAIDGDRAVIGESAGQGQNAAGRVRIYDEVGGAWMHALAFDSPEGIGTGLGITVDVTGDHALAGAPLADGDVGDFAGAVYTFERVDGAWMHTGLLGASNLDLTDQLGGSLAIDGDLAIVGATQFFNVGKAYVYRLVDGDWYELGIISPAAGVSGEAFGFSTAIDQPLAVVGSFSGDGVVENSGCAYVFETLTLDPTFTIDSGVSEVAFTVTIGENSDTATAHALGTTIAELTEDCDGYSTLQVTGVDVSTKEGVLEVNLPLLDIVYHDPQFILAPGLGTPPSPGEIEGGMVSQNDGAFTFGGMIDLEILGQPFSIDMTTVDPQPFSMDIALGEAGLLTATFDFGQEIIVDFGLGDNNPVMNVDGSAVGTAILGDECFPDCDANGVLNILDFVCYQQLFQSGDPGADCDANGVLNILDFVCFQQAFQAGCP